MALMPAYTLALGGASDSQREAVQALVKAHANGWWHNLPDVWIVGGHNHKYWADLIHPVLASSTARLLVLELPRDPSTRTFAYRGPFPRTTRDWLWKTYLDRVSPQLVLKKAARKKPGDS
jgi:hypothetical protein